MPKAGWLQRQSQEVAADIQKWPSWMRREAGLETSSGEPAEQAAKRNGELKDRGKTDGEEQPSR